MSNAELSCAHDESHVVGCSMFVDCTRQGVRARSLHLCMPEGARAVPLLSMEHVSKLGNLQESPPDLQPHGYSVLIRAYSKRECAVLTLRVFDEMRIAWVERNRMETERAGAGGTFHISR